MPTQEEIISILEPCSEFLVNFRNVASCPETVRLGKVLSANVLDSMVDTHDRTKFPCIFANCNQDAYIGLLGLCSLLRHFQEAHGLELNTMGCGRILLSNFMSLLHDNYLYIEAAFLAGKGDECLDEIHQRYLRALGTKVDRLKLHSSYKIEPGYMDVPWEVTTGQIVQDLVYCLQYRVRLKEAELYFQIKSTILRLLGTLEHSAMCYTELLKEFFGNILQLNDRLDRLSKILSSARKKFTSSCSNDLENQKAQILGTARMCQRYVEHDINFISLVRALWKDLAKRINTSETFTAQREDFKWEETHGFVIQTLDLTKLLMDIWANDIWNLFIPVYSFGGSFTSFGWNLPLDDRPYWEYDRSGPPNSWQMGFRASDYNVFEPPMSSTKTPRKNHSMGSQLQSSYQPLYMPIDSATEEIRVVFVSMDASGQLHARMTHISLDKKMPYIALSYVWGGHRSETLPVNEVPVKITENLLAALRTNMVLDYSSQGIPIWVDAICINQEDLQEKNTEVLRMRRIYAQSRETICWLGKSAGNSDQAFDFLADVSISCVSKPTEQQCIGLYQLFSRAWWIRVWTMQEAVVPPAIRLACGDRHIKVGNTMLSSLISTTIRLKNEVASSYSFPLIEHSFHRLEMLNTLRTSWFLNCSRGIPLDLLNLLVASRHALATDSRDKVFGILALAGDGKSLIARPDYQLSKRELYSQLVAGWVTLYNSVDMICHAGTVDATPDLPSWVPDWADGKSSSSFSSLTWYVENKSNFPQVNILASIPPRFCHELSRMTIWAYELDRIQYVAENDSSCATKPCVIHGDTNVHTVRYSSISMAFHALLRTVCGDQVSGTHWASLDTIEFRHALHGILRYQGPRWTAASSLEADECIRSWFLRNSDFKIGNFSIRELVSQLPSQLPGSEEARCDISPALHDFKEKFLKVTLGRSLFTTSTGYLGISRQTVMPGDISFLVPHCSAPLVLRQTAQSFRFIGDSYIHPTNGEPSMYGQWDAPGSDRRFIELKRITLV